ncbi:MAG: hypothetical protein ABI852_04665 [Gemmatimonadaceae bacterium]
MLIDLYNKDTNAPLGSITETELQHMRNSLEVESDRDTDFYIQKDTLGVLGNDGLATEHLLQILRDAVGTSDGLEVRWEKREHTE